jgi:hypothetical protein
MFETTHQLQTREQHVTEQKLYQSRRATIIDILSENSKKEYLMSVTESLCLEKREDICNACNFINKIPKFILKN